jgi:hypothetical protein
VALRREVDPEGGDFRAARGNNRLLGDKERNIWQYFLKLWIKKWQFFLGSPKIYFAVKGKLFFLRNCKKKKKTGKI